MLLQVPNKIISLQLKLSKKLERVPSRVQVSHKTWEPRDSTLQPGPIGLRIPSIAGSQRLFSSLRPQRKLQPIFRECMPMLLKNKIIHSPESSKKIRRHSGRLSKCETPATLEPFLRDQVCWGLCRTTRATTLWDCVNLQRLDVQMSQTTNSENRLATVHMLLSAKPFINPLMNVSPSKYTTVSSSWIFKERSLLLERSKYLANLITPKW